MHFLSDVVAGSALGASFGYAATQLVRIVYYSFPN
jgi:membrane-associated phospholipid phosphatase